MRAGATGAGGGRLNPSVPTDFKKCGHDSIKGQGMKKTIVILLLGALTLYLAGVVIFNTRAQLVVYDYVVKSLGDAPEVALQEQVALALMRKGAALDQLNLIEEGIAAYDEVVKRYGNAPETVLREKVARSLFNKGVMFFTLNRREEGVAAYDEVVKRYGNAPEAELRENVAIVLGIKGNRLGVLNRYEEAFAAYGEVMKRYGSAPEAKLRERVTMTLSGWGRELVFKAKKVWQGGDSATAAGLLKQALEKNEAARQRKPDEPKILGNQGYILFLLGRVGEARPILAKAIALGGEELRQELLKFADRNPLPQDKAFKALIESL